MCVGPFDDEKEIKYLVSPWIIFSIFSREIDL